MEDMDDIDFNRDCLRIIRAFWIADRLNEFVFTLHGRGTRPCIFNLEQAVNFAQTLDLRTFRNWKR